MQSGRSIFVTLIESINCEHFFCLEFKSSTQKHFQLIQLQEELEDQQRLESQSRKKLHKLNAELSDAKIHLEETTVKNHELEKKQRK